MSSLRLNRAAAPALALFAPLQSAWRQAATAAKRVFNRAPRTAAQEARHVRDLAATMAGDPRIVAELYAAADRHERLHGVN